MTMEPFQVVKIVEANNLSDMIYEAVSKSDKLQEFRNTAIRVHELDEECEGQTLMRGTVEMMVEKDGWNGDVYSGYQEIEFEINRGSTTNNRIVNDHCDYVFGELEVILGLDVFEADLPEPTWGQDR